MTALTPRRIWLIGSMGCGKTVVGRELAALLGWALVDNDEELEASEGRSLTDLAGVGADYLHDREAAQLHRAVGLPPPFIAGVAASVGDRPPDLELLAATGSVAYLRATVTTLADRVAHGAGRPWLDDAPVAWLTDTLRRREPGYLAVADSVVDVDGRTPAEVARAVLADLGADSATPVDGWHDGERS